MDIRIEELDAKQMQTIAAAYLEMVVPMMKKWGSEEQKKSFDVIAQNLVSTRAFDSEELLRKATLLIPSEAGRNNAYGEDVLDIAFAAVRVFGKECAASFQVLHKKITELISLLNDVISSLEDIVEQNLTLIKVLENNQSGIKDYIHIEALHSDEDEYSRPKTYCIKAELNRLFQDATDDMVKILSEKGTVNKKAYIDQVVSRVRRVMKAPIEVISKLNALQIERTVAAENAAVETSGVSKEHEVSELAVSAEALETPEVNKAPVTNVRAGESVKTAYLFVKEEDSAALIDAVFDQFDKKDFLNTMKNLAEEHCGYGINGVRILYAKSLHPEDCDYFGESGVAFTIKTDSDQPTKITVVGEEAYYDILCEKQKQFKFAKVQQKQVDTMLEKIKDILCG